MYYWYYDNYENMVFMQSWKSAALTVTKWNFQAMSSPRKASLWIQLKSKLCQNGRLHIRCEMCNAF